ncbi:MAG TPA: glycogen synthase GlgA [Vicinamibacterales bacterium]
MRMAKKATKAAAPKKATGNRSARLRVLMVASECAPFAKTGGLADAVAGLAGALVRLGHHVTLVLPGYRGLAADSADAGYVFVPTGFETRSVQLRELTSADGVRLILVDEPVFATREQFYGEHGADYHDNAARFALLSRAALQFAVRDGERFDVLHAHDWHASLAPVYLKTRYADQPAAPRGSVFTIHNLAFQGLFDIGDLPLLDLDPSLFSVDALEYWGRASALKGGCVFADWVTTVSPSYARETRETELGFGFQGILSARGDRYVGILNGIDTAVWNPEADPYLPEPYSAADPSGKAAAKAELLREFGLAGTGGPVVGMVTRLAHQKGTDLVREVLPRLADRLTLVLLGAGEPALEAAWQRLADAYPDRIGVRIGFDERLAHLIEAGADMFLMPSRWEPCGLNQMYSLRYGTPPVVHAVGGLNDTVTPRTGFKFAEATAESLQASLAVAVETWGNTRKWRALQRAGMQADFSWDRSAAEYVKVYRSAIQH